MRWLCILLLTGCPYARIRGGPSLHSGGTGYFVEATIGFEGYLDESNIFDPVRNDDRLAGGVSVFGDVHDTGAETQSHVGVAANLEWDHALWKRPWSENGTFAARAGGTVIYGVGSTSLSSTISDAAMRAWAAAAHAEIGVAETVLGSAFLGAGLQVARYSSRLADTVSFVPFLSLTLSGFALLELGR